MNSEFNSCANEYDKFRPNYPETLFELLIKTFNLSKNSIIVDVGCGTAKSSLPFAKRGISVIGLDSSKEMLVLAEKMAIELNLPMTFLASNAENIQLPNNTFSFVNCAQAFHWFDSQKALTEFARILKPNGGLAIYWNNRDHKKEPYLTKVEDLISKYNPKHKLAYQAQNWTEVLKQSKLFTNISHRSFSHSAKLSIDDFIGLTQSFSYVRNVLNNDTKHLFEKELKDLLISVSVDNLVNLPYEVKLWFANKSQ
jgi:ubiquinone/menaquinone biosynthesis C-methylase UbiE